MITYRLIIFFSLCTLLSSCNNSDQPSTNNKKQEATKSALSFAPVITSVPIQPQDKPYTGQYCYIKRVFTKADTVYIEADYVQFYMGAEALAAAKKDGNTDALDDYYIVNENIQLRSLPLANNVQLEIVQDGRSVSSAQNIEAFEQDIKDQLVVLTIEKGIVKKVRQQFVP